MEELREIVLKNIDPLGMELRLFSSSHPTSLLIYIGEKGYEGNLESLMEKISEKHGSQFAFLSISLSEKEVLLPFPSHSPFDKSILMGNADKTCVDIEAFLLSLLGQYPELNNIPIILGGYSLCALFCLYLSSRSSLFPYVASNSPSLWYEGFLDYSSSAFPKSRFVHLSIGEKEEKGKNALFSKVGDNIRAYSALLKEKGIENQLIYHNGGHFSDIEKRIVEGYLACLKKI